MAKRKKQLYTSPVYLEFLNNRAQRSLIVNNSVQNAAPNSYYEDFGDLGAEEISYDLYNTPQQTEDERYLQQLVNELREDILSEKESLAPATLSHWLDVGRTLTKKAAETILSSNQEQLSELFRGKESLQEMNLYADNVDKRTNLLQQLRGLFKQLGATNHKTGGTDWSDSELIDIANDIATGDDRNARNLLTLMSVGNANISKVAELSKNIDALSTDIRQQEDYFKGEGRLDPTIRKVMYNSPGSLSEYGRTLLSNFNSGYTHTDEVGDSFGENAFGAITNAITSAGGYLASGLWHTLTDPLKGNAADNAIQNVPSYSPLIDQLFVGDKSGGTVDIRERIKDRSAHLDRKRNEIEAKVNADREFYTNGVFHPTVVLKSMSNAALDFAGFDPEIDDVKQSDLSGEWYNKFKFYDPNQINPEYKKAQEENSWKFWRPDYWIPEVGSTIGMSGSMVGSMASNIVAAALLKKLPVWVNPMTHSTAYGLTKAGIMALDLSAGIYFTKRSREMETSSEKINALASRLVDSLRKSGAQYNQTMSQIKEALKEFGVDADRMEPVDLMLNAIAYNIRTGGMFDIELEKSREGLQKLVNLNNSLAYSDYIGAVLPFTSYGGSFYNWFAGGMSRAGEKLVGSRAIRGFTSKTAEEVISKRLASQQASVVRNMQNKVGLLPETVQKYAAQTQGMLDATIGNLASRMVAKGVPVERALATKQALQYTKNVASKVLGIGLVEGTEEGVQDLLQKNYQSGAYDDYKQPYSIFSIPDVLEDVGLSSAAWADLIGVNFDDPYNGDAQLRKAMAIGFLASLGLPVAGGAIGNARSLIGKDDNADNLVGLIRQIQADYNVRGVINDDIKSALETELKNNRLVTSSVGSQLLSVQDDEHAGVFFDSLSKGVSAGRLLNALIDYKSLIGDDDLVSSRFIDDDIKILNAVNLAYENQWLKDHLKKKGLAIGGEEHKEMAKDMAQFVIDSSVSNDLQKEAVTGDGRVRSKLLDKVRSWFDNSQVWSEDEKDLFNSENPFVQAIVSLIEDNYDQMLPYQINNSEALAEARRKYVEQHYKDFWDTNSEAGTNEKPHQGVKGNKNRATRRLLRRFNKSYDKITTVLDYDTLESYDEAEGYNSYIEAEAKRVAGKFFDGLVEEAKRNQDIARDLVLGYMNVSKKFAAENLVTRMLDYIERVQLDKVKSMLDDKVKANDMLKAFTGADIDSSSIKSLLTTIDKFVKDDDASRQRNGYKLDEELKLFGDIIDMIGEDVTELNKFVTQYVLNKAAHVHANKVSKAYTKMLDTTKTSPEDLVAELYDKDVIPSFVLQSIDEWRKNKEAFDTTDDLDKTLNQEKQVGEKADDAIFEALYRRIKDRMQRKKVAHRIWELERPILADDINSETNAIVQEEAEAERRAAEEPSVASAESAEVPAETPANGSETPSILDSSAGVSLRTEVEGYNPSAERRRRAAMEAAGRNADAEAAAEQHVAEQNDSVTQEEDAAERSAEERTEQPEASTATPAEGQAEAQAETPSAPQAETQEGVIAESAQQPEGSQTQRQTLINIEFTDQSGRHMSQERQLEVLLAIYDVVKGKSRRKASQRARFGTANRVVTRNQVARALQFLRLYFGGDPAAKYVSNPTLSTIVPMNPHVSAALGDLAIFCVEGGARTFVDFAKAMLDNLRTVFSDEELEQIAYNQFEDLYIGAVDKLEQFGITTSGTGTPPEDNTDLTQQPTQQGQETQEPAAEVQPVEKVEDGDTTVEQSDQPVYEELQKEAAMDITSGTELTQGDSKDIDSGVALTEALADIVRDEQQFLSQLEYGIGFALRVDVQDGVITVDGIKTDRLTQGMMLLDFEQQMSEEASGIINHASSVANGTNGKYATRKVDVTGLAHHTFNYRPDSSDALPITDGEDEIKLEHPISTGKKLAENLIKDGWFESTKKYYVITRYDKNDTNTDSFKIHLILDDGVNSYVLYLPTLESSAARIYGLESLLRLRLGKRGTIFEDERNNEKVREGLFLYEKRIVEEIYSKNAVYDPKPNIVVDTHGFLTKESIKEQLEWSQRAMKWYKTSPERSKFKNKQEHEQAVQQWQQSVKKILERARMMAAKPNETPATDEQIDEEIEKLRQVRNQIIDATLQKTVVNGETRYVFPDSSKTYPTTSEPEYVDVSNGQINSVKNEFGEPVYRKVSTDTAEDITRQIRDGELVLGLGLGLFSKTAPGQKTIRTLGGGDVLTGNGRSGKIYWMVKSRDGVLRIPIQLAEQKFNTQQTARGDVKQLVGTHGKPNVTLTINPETGVIDTSKCMPSAAEVLLYLICGKRIMTNDGLLNRADKNLLFALSRFFVNNGEMTLLHSKSRQAQKLLAPFAQKQIAYYTPEGSTTPIFEIAFPVMQNDTLTYQAQVFNNPDVQIFGNTEEAINNRARIVTAIANQLHWNTEEDDMIQSFSKGPNASIVMQLLRNFFMSNPQESVSIGGCPQLTFNRSDLFDENINPKNVTVGAWTLSTGRLFTDVSEQLFKDPFVFAHGVRQNNAKELVQNAKRQNNQPETAPVTSVVEQQAAQAEKIERIKKKSAGKFNLTQTPEDKKTFLEDLNSKFSSKRFIDVLALDIQARGKKYNDIKANVSNLLHQWARQNNVNIDEIDFQYFGENIVSSNLLRNNGYPLVRVYEKDGKTIAEVSVLNHRTTLSNVPTATGVYSKNKGEGKLDERKARKWLRNVLGLSEKNVVVEDAIMRSTDGEEVYGLTRLCYDALVDELIGNIHLSRSNGRNVEFHEAWHYVNLLLHNKQQRRVVWASYIKQHPELADKTYQEIEELIADEFKEYMTIRTSYKPTALLRRLYDNVLSLLSASRRKSAYRHVFQEIRKGTYKGMKLDQNSKKEFLRRYPGGVTMRGYIPTVEMSVTDSMDTMETYHDFYDTSASVINHIMSQLDIRSLSDIKKMSGKNFSETLNLVKQFAEMQPEGSVARDRIMTLYNNPLAFLNEIFARMAKFGINAKIKNFDGIEETELAEELEEDAGLNYDRVELNISKKENIGLEAKLFMSRIPKLVRVPGEDEPVQSIDDFGVPEVYDFDEVWGAVLDNLGPCQSFGERDGNGDYKKNSMLGVSQRMGRANLLMRSVYNELSSLTDPYFLQTALKQALFGTINSSKPNIQYVVINDPKNASFMSMEEQMIAMEYGQQQTPYEKTADVKRELSLFNDNRFHVARHITGRWSKNAVLQGIQELKDGKAVVSEQFVSKLCDILGCTVENAAGGRFFGDLKQDSLLYNVQKLTPTKTNVLSEDEITDLVYTVKEQLDNLLTQMGIESDPDVIETLITMLSDSDSMTPRTQASTLEKMLKSVDKNGGTLLSIIRILASSIGKTELDTGVKDGKPIDEVFNRYKFGTWIATLAMAYNSEHPSSAEYSVIGPDGNMKYPISQNNYVSDVHNALNNAEGRSNNINENDDKISYAAKMMRSPYCRHSIVLLAAMELNDKSLLDDRIKLYAFIGFKDGNSNEGEDYFAMSAVEDYIAKMLILESDHVTAADRKNISKGLTVDKIAQLILPTMADKKSYFTYGSRNIKLSHDVITVGESPMLRKNVQKQYFESEILPRITEEEASKYEKLLPTEKDSYIEGVVEKMPDEERAILKAEIGYVQETTSSNSFSENTLNRFMGYFKDEVDALIQYYDKKNIAHLVEHPGDARENFHGKIKNGRMDFSGNGGLFRYFYDVRTYTDANGVQYNMNQKLEALWKLLKLIESGKVKLADAKQSDLLKYVNISSLGYPAQLDGFELIRAYLKNLSESSFGKDGRNWNEEVKRSINRSLMRCVDSELYRLSVDPAYDIVRYTGTGYDSVALPHQLLNNYIDDMANLGLCPSGSFETQITDWVRENAVRSLIANNVVNTITSVIEYEKIFHGDPAFYKLKGIRGKNGKLKINVNGDLKGNAINLDVTVDNIYDKFSDKIKRLGGNESPGQELCLDYTEDELQADMDIREDFLKSLNILNPRQMNTSKYTILHLEDCSATSLHIEHAVRQFKVQTTIDFIRANKVPQFDKFAKGIQKEGLTRTIEQVIDILYTKPKVFDNFWKTIDEDVRKEIMSNVRAQIKPFTDITVADAQVFIRPEMYRQIRIDLGEWSTVEDESGYSDERAYQILETNPNWMNEPESARIVARLSLYPLKMSYFQNDNENLGTQSTSVPAYNKMAIFPIFKYTASTPLGLKIYDRMNRNFNEIDMLAFKSAVKVGGVQGGIETVSKDALQELCYINSVAFEMSTDEVQQEIAKLYMKKGMSESAAQQKASEYTASKIALTCKEYKQHIAEQTSFIDDEFLLDSDKYVDCSSNETQTKEDTSNRIHVLVQDLKNLRLQLNTKAHKHLERSLGTQLLKTAFQNIFDECQYGIGREGKAVRSGKQIKQDVIDCVDALTVAGVKKIHNMFYNKDKVDHGKVARWTQQVAKNNGLGIAAETILKSGGAIASLLSSKLFEQTMVKAIQKEVVDVSTNGGTAIQLSCYGFAAYGKDSVSEYSEQGYHQYNDGKELNWVCESSADGQSMRRGSMEVLLSMNFFKNVIPLDVYSQGYTAQRQWLIDHDIISGTKTDGALANPSPFGIGYRIPTQGPSSLFAFTVADVLPDTSADVIIVPREFTAQTGSDFDVDKLYLATMSYTDGVMDLIQFNYDMDYIESVGEEYALSLDKDQFRQNATEYAKKKGLPVSEKDLRKMKRSERLNFLSKQTVGAVRNRLLQNYMDVTTDIKMFGLSRASIDAITNKIYSDLLPYVQSTPLEYISSFEELTPTFQSIKKREFGTGKDGIAPFALNAVNITFTQATHLSLDYGDNPYDLKDLDKSIGEDGISIAAYLSAMINAHVDVAKDPYVFAINVNPATYNHVNLLLRAGKGFKALKFIAQPALKQYATKVLQSKSLYGGNLDGKTPEGGISQITKNAIYNATMAQLVSELKVLHDECAKQLTEEQNKLFITTVGYFGVKASARTVKKVDPRAIDIFNEQLQTEALKNYKNTSKTALELYNATMFQIYTMHAFNKLLANADKLAELVHTSLIDTKKFGNTIPSMLHFMNKYKVFIKTTQGFVITTDRENSIKNNDALQRYFSGLFLNEKLTKTILMSREMLSQTAFTATHEFGTLLFDICRLMYGTEYDKNDNIVGYKSTVSSDSVETLARAIESVMKYDALVAKGPDVLRKLGNSNNRADEGLIDFVFDGNMDVIRYNVKRVLFGDPLAKNEADKKSIVDRLFEFVNYIKQHPDSIHAQGLIANGLISNDILEYLKPFPKSESLPIGQIKLLTSQMNTSEDQKQRLISAFYDLLTHPSERVRKLARDLCIYGYYTSYNQNSRNNFVELIPPVYRVQYDNALAQALASRDLMNNSIMNDNTADVSDLKLSERLMRGGIESIASKYLQAVARNFWYDDNIVPRYYERSRRGGLLNDKGGEITLSSFVPAGSTFSFYGAILSSRVRAGNMDNPMFFKVTKGNTTVLYMNIGEVNVPKGEDGFTKYHMYIAIPKAGLHLNGIKAYEFYANYGVASVYEQNKMPETWAPINLLKQIQDVVQKSQEQIGKSSEREITINRSITDDLLSKYSNALEDGSINSDIYFEVTEANSAVHGIVQARGIYAKEDLTESVVKSSSVVFEINRSSIPQDSKDRSKVITIDTSSGIHDVVKQLSDVIGQSSILLNDDKRNTLPQKLRGSFDDIYQTGVSIGIVGDVTTQQYTEEQLNEYKQQLMNLFKSRNSFKDLTEEEQNSAVQQYQRYLDNISGEDLNQLMLNQYIESLLKQLILSGVRINNVRTQYLGGNNYGPDSVAKAAISAARNVEDYMAYSRVFVHTYMKHLRNGVTDDLNDTLKYSDDQEQLSGDFMQEVFILKAEGVKQTYSEIYDILNNANNRVADMQNDEVNTHLEELALSAAEEVVKTAEKIGAGASALALLGAAQTDVEITSETQSEQSGSEGLNPSGEQAKENKPKPLSGLAALAAAQTEVDMPSVEKQAAKNIESGNTKEEEC